VPASLLNGVSLRQTSSSITLQLEITALKVLLSARAIVLSGTMAVKLLLPPPRQEPPQLLQLYLRQHSRGLQKIARAIFKHTYKMSSNVFFL
jgi:hypothetical protein